MPIIAVIIIAVAAFFFGGTFTKSPNPPTVSTPTPTFEIPTESSPTAIPTASSQQPVNIFFIVPTTSTNSNSAQQPTVIYSAPRPTAIQIHRVCSNGGCNYVDGPGPDTCQASEECHHNECQNGACVRIDQPGTNQCIGTLSGLDCHHGECQNGKCVQINTPGLVGPPASCMWDEQCQ